MNLPIEYKQGQTIDSSDSMDMFDFRNTMNSLYDAVRFNTLTVLITTLIVLALAATYHYIWPPVYTVNAVIMVERSDDAQRDAFYKEWNLFRKNDSRTEIKLMKSGTVLRDVIEKESLRYNDVYHPVMSQISYFWEISYPGRAYKAVKTWLLGPSEVDTLTPEEKELGKTIRDMREGFFVVTAGDILIGEIEGKGPSPRISQITNTWIDSYLEWRKNQHLEEARRSLKSLTAQIDRVHKEILEISRERVEFLGENNLVFDFSKETQEVGQLVTLESEIASTQTRIAIISASLSQINKQLKQEQEQKIISSVTELNQLRETAKLKRLELKTTLIRELYRFNDDSPEIKRIKGQIIDLDALINNNPENRKQTTTTALNPIRTDLERKKSNLEAELSGLEAGLKSMARIQGNLKKKLTEAPIQAAQLRDLDRRYSVAQQVYKVLLTKRAQADISLLSSAEAMPSMRVVDYATPPASKSWPKAKYLYPGALGVGIILGIFAALIKSMLSAKVTLRHFDQGSIEIPLYAIIDVKTDGLRQPILPVNPLPSTLISAQSKNQARANT